MKKIYLLTTLISLIIGLLLIYVFNNIHLLRNHFSDVLIIIFMFSFIKTFKDIDSFKLLVLLVLFSVFIEILQYYKVADILELKPGIIRTMLGTNFDIIDLFIYIFTGIAIYPIDKKVRSYFKIKKDY